MFLVFKIHASLYKKMQCISNYPTKEASYRKKKWGSLQPQALNSPAMNEAFVHITMIFLNNML